MVHNIFETITWQPIHWLTSKRATHCPTDTDVYHTPGLAASWCCTRWWWRDGSMLGCCGVFQAKRMRAPVCSLRCPSEHKNTYGRTRVARRGHGSHGPARPERNNAEQWTKSTSRITAVATICRGATSIIQSNQTTWTFFAPSRYYRSSPRPMDR